MTIAATAVTTLKRQYPHVDQIGDFAAAQSVRLLWDRVFALQEQLTAAQATITTLVSTANVADAKIAVVKTAADAALAMGQIPGTAPGSTTTTPPEAPLPGGGDGGKGQEGCAACGPDGHDSGGLLNAVRAGQIACGTGNEYSALRNPTATLEDRVAQATELMLRVVWHLRQGGFTAGRQRNPSGALSKDKMCVVVDGVTRAYDMFASSGIFTSAMNMQMFEVGPADMVDDDGIPD